MAVDLSSFRKTGVNITAFALLQTASPLYRRVAAANVFRIPRKILVISLVTRFIHLLSYLLAYL